MRILLVEDDANLIEALREILGKNGFLVKVATDGQSAYQEAMGAPYDIILMDRMLPKMDGLEVTKRLRENGYSGTIIMLTAMGAAVGDIAPRIEGLNAGADDYMTKPFSPSELIARINAIIRRQTPTRTPDGKLHYGDLTFDENTLKLSTPKNSIILSRLEGRILSLLMIHPETTFSKKMIKLQIWGEDQEVKPNNIEAYVSMIRKDFKKIGSKVYINTIRRRGYQLELVKRD